jgi:hypothetical protein
MGYRHRGHAAHLLARLLEFLKDRHRALALGPNVQLAVLNPHASAP